MAEEVSAAGRPARVGDGRGSRRAATAPPARAVLFYGSCLREKQLDGLMLDFYLIVSTIARPMDRAGWRRPMPWSRPMCFRSRDGLAAKYAVLSEQDFWRLNGPETRNVSVWARFAQPSRLVWAADECRARLRN